MGDIYHLVFVFNYKQKFLSINRTFVGMATMCEIMAKMSRGTVDSQHLVGKVVTNKFRTVDFILTFLHTLKIVYRFNFMIVWPN